MAKIVVDRSGKLEKGVFYRFEVPLADAPEWEGEKPQLEWIVAQRTPTDDMLSSIGERSWMRIAESGDTGTEVRIKDCPLDPTHSRHHYYRKFIGLAHGGKRFSPIVPTMNFHCFGLSDDLRRRIDSLRIRGARIDPIDLLDEIEDRKVPGFWALQFVGSDIRRHAKVVDGPNACPYCGKTKVICEACGYWTFNCDVCGKHTLVSERAHQGQEDKRVAYEHDTYRFLEGKDWDGSDLICGDFRFYTSKRFVDWLLRIHAAPFYAEPVWFCVDGMNDRQKKRFDELQKPFDV